MDLQQMRAIGAFKDRSLVKRTITVRHFPELHASEWEEPGVPLYGDKVVEHTFEVFIRKRSSADAVEVASGDRRLMLHYNVWRCVVDAKGEQVFADFDDVLALQEWMLLPLSNAVMEVNQTGPKRSPPVTKRGANSRSGSGAARSRNGRKPSASTSGASGTRSGPSTAR